MWSGRVRNWPLFQCSQQLHPGGEPSARRKRIAGSDISERVTSNTVVGEFRHSATDVGNARKVLKGHGAESVASWTIPRRITLTAQEHENEVNKEIASASRALFLAAFTVIVGSAATAWFLYFFQVKV